MIELHEHCAKCKLNCALEAWAPKTQAFRKSKFIFIVENPLDGIEHKLRKVLRMCSFTSEDYSVLYATRCTVEDEKPGVKEIKACLPMLIQDLDQTRGDAILIPMGAAVCKELLGRKVGSVHGSLLEFHGRICVPTYHPLQVYAYPDALPNFEKDLARIVDAGNGIVTEQLKTNYKFITTLKQARKMAKELLASPKFTFDIETSGLDPFATDPPAKVVTINFSNAPQQGFVIPVDHREAPWTPEEREEVVELLREILESDVRKGAHNGKFDWKYIKQYLGITVKNYCFDTMYAHYLGVTEEPGTHGLKSLAWEFTDMGGYDDPLEDYKSEHPEAQTNYDLVPLELLSQYGAGDSDCTFRLWDLFEPMLEADEGLSHVFHTILMPASIALAKMELRGAYIDQDHLEVCRTEFSHLMEDIHAALRDYPEVIEAEKLLTKAAVKAKKNDRIKQLVLRSDKLAEIKKTEGKTPRYTRGVARLEADVEKFKTQGVNVAPVTFSPGSSDHKRLLLYKVLKMPVLKMTPKKVPSTDKEVMKELYAEHPSPLLQMLGRFTKLNTLYNMFVKSMPERLCADGRVRGSFNPIGTVTGRLSSSGPNLQQIPKNVKEDKFLADIKVPSIKKMFTVRNPKKWCVMQFDYSQAELRVLASLAEEPTFIAAFNNGEDIHKRTAADVNGVDLDDVTDGQRGAAKAVNFGLLYGQGAAKLAKGTGMTLDEAKAFIRLYFQKLPRIQRYINHVKARVKSEGEVRSPFGRLRRLATAFSPEPDIVASAERQAVNSPIQSAASDCTLAAIIAITAWLERNNMKSYIMITVHDSIVLAVYKPEAVKVYKKVKKIMENPPADWLLVPMTADAEIGPDWGTLTKVESVDDIIKFLEPAS